MERAEMVKIMKKDCEEKIVNNIKDLKRIAEEIEAAGKNMQRDLNTNERLIKDKKLGLLDMDGNVWSLMDVKNRFEEYERVLNELNTNKELLKAMYMLEKQEESK